MRVLFILPYGIIPPDSGNKNLTFGLLKYLVPRTTCDIALLVDEHKYEPSIVESDLRKEFPGVRRVVVFKKPIGSERRWGRVRTLLHGKHPSLGSYLSTTLEQWLQSNVSRDTYDLIHFDMIHTTLYRSSIKDVPSLIVASDAYSMAAREAAALLDSVTSRAKALFESWLLRNIESSDYPHFSMVCTVSDRDAAYLRSVSPGSNVRTIGIGVSAEYAERDIKHADSDALTFPRILLTGSLNHPVIAQGIVDFLEKSLPQIREKFPEVGVVVLGRGPHAILKECLYRDHSVEYLDFVEDYAAFLDQNWIYVYPQLCATGLQTKLQQAMALGLPVVTFPVSLGGLNVSNGKHCLICDNQTDLTRNVESLLRDPDLRRKIGTLAQAHIREKFSLECIGKQMLSLYQDLI
ncbi:MAG: glycosyltransferase family 4 protein [Sedimenticola sp.]